MFIFILLEGTIEHTQDKVMVDYVKRGASKYFYPRTPNYMNLATYAEHQSQDQLLCKLQSQQDISHSQCEENRVYLRHCVRADAEEFAEGHTQALMEVMVDPATSFDPLCIPLQKIQNQWSQVSCNQ